MLVLHLVTSVWRKISQKASSIKEFNERPYCEVPEEADRRQWAAHLHFLFWRRLAIAPILLQANNRYRQQFGRIIFVNIVVL